MIAVIANVSNAKLSVTVIVKEKVVVETTAEVVLMLIDVDGVNTYDNIQVCSNIYVELILLEMKF